MAKKAGKKVSKKAKAGKSTKRVCTKKFRIHGEFRDLLPKLTQEEYNVLQDSIRREGLREPLVIWKEKGILIDGHNRRDICKKLKIKPATREQSFDSKDAVKLWIWENQEGRRNLTAFQRIEATLNLKDIIAEQAKERQRESGGAVRLKLDKPIHTYKMLGERAGVSHGTVRKAEKILKKVAEGVINSEVIDALRNGTVLHEGKVTIDRVYKQYCGKQTDGKKASQPKHDLTERSNSIIKLLKMQVARSFHQTEDRTSLYDKIIEWATTQKAGLEEPSE